MNRNKMEDFNRWWDCHLQCLTILAEAPLTGQRPVNFPPWQFQLLACCSLLPISPSHHTPHSHPCPSFRLPNQEGRPRWGIYCPNFSLCSQNIAKLNPNIISALHVNQNNNHYDENIGSFPFAQTSERFYKFLQGLSRFKFEDNFTKHVCNMYTTTRASSSST